MKTWKKTSRPHPTPIYFPLFPSRWEREATRERGAEAASGRAARVALRSRCRPAAPCSPRGVRNRGRKPKRRDCGAMRGDLPHLWVPETGVPYPGGGPLHQREGCRQRAPPRSTWAPDEETCSEGLGFNTSYLLVMKGYLKNRILIHGA